MKTFLLHLWQLPQHIVAWVIILFCYVERKPDYKGRKVYRYRLKRSCSLGEYIFVSPNATDPVTVAHEYGHSVQSRILGPLYLFTVGICSAAIPFSGARYYRVWCEAWANKIGGVEVVKTGDRVCDYALKLVK